MARQVDQDNPTFDLFSEEEKPIVAAGGLDWPHPARFPLNNTGAASVRTVVFGDLKQSASPLLVTGYASLDQIIDFSCDACETPGHEVRLLIGNEPYASRRDTFSMNRNDLTQEMSDYWLQRGISLVYSAKIIRMLGLLKAGRIQARCMPGGRRLHAKIYCGDEAAMVGSSNFTDAGLQFQHEANVRFDAHKDPKRFEELTQIAGNFWKLGSSYQEELVALLENLLQVVRWQEALARACAELLEGEWAESYLRGGYLAGAGELWPSQKQGIAQALYVLSNQGSVLIADATGAGKTRMGTYLIGAVQDDILRKGRVRQGKTLMICPPSVEEDWMRESTLSGVPLETYSHGKLSSKRARRHALTIEALRRAHVQHPDGLPRLQARREIDGIADAGVRGTLLGAGVAGHHLARGDAYADVYRCLLRRGSARRALREPVVHRWAHQSGSPAQDRTREMQGDSSGPRFRHLHKPPAVQGHGPAG